MLLSLPRFEYLSCHSLEEACSLLFQHRAEARVLAGGTDLLVKMKHRRLLPAYLVNIKKIPGLDYIRTDGGGGIRIGALTTIQTIRRSPLIMKRYPVLSQAAGVLGTAHVRNLATLGGNLCNASPASECAAPLLTLEATVEIAGREGGRSLPLESFFLGPGKSALNPGEIVTEVRIPEPPPHTRGVHLKYGTRRVDVAIAGASLMMTLHGKTCKDVRIALAAVAPTPFRARRAEDLLRGQTLNGGTEQLLERVAQAAAEATEPIDDVRASAAERRDLVKLLVRQGIDRAIAGTAA